ncbi:MEDS domain-containing protein [Pseudonocardia bannensis]|nr:MEDS domain-containing protein [Pseudonocardia bannensis]
MRASGTVEDTTGYGLHDHLCVAYDDQVEFRAQARRFFSDGLALGQRVR